MKNLFRTLVACLLLAWVGGIAASCTTDTTLGDEVDPQSSSKFKLIGEPEVINAVSINIPVEGVNLETIYTYVREYAVGEDGEEYFVQGYDTNGNPILTQNKVSTPTPSTVKRKGVQLDGGELVEIVKLSSKNGLKTNRNYYAYIVAELANNKFYGNGGKGKVLSVKFATPEKYSDQDVEVLDQSYEGINVAVNIPQSVLEKGHRAKWGITNIPTLAYYGNTPMAQSLHHCDYVYPAFLINGADTLLEINHYNAYRRNAKGEVPYYVIDTEKKKCIEVSPDSDEALSDDVGPITYYYEFMPGEPLVLMLAEVGYADCDAQHDIKECEQSGKKHPTTDWGWGPGWYWFPYDMVAYENAARGDNFLPDMGMGGGSASTVDPEQFWHEGAWHRKIELRLPGPKKFHGSVKITKDNISPKDGTITFTPDKETYMYLVAIIEDTNEYGQGYRDITRDYLDGDESLWQWFTTSEIAPYLCGVMPLYASEGPQSIKLSEFFESVVAGRKYHVMVNAMGKKLVDGDYVVDPTSQNFTHTWFYSKEYTKDAPRLEVTAAEPYSPWQVKYIVKNPDWRTNPVEKVSYTANYSRDFDMYMKANEYDYTDMAMMNAYYNLLSDTDIDAVNSDEGAVVKFDVLEDSEFTAVFIGWNSEGRASNPDDAQCPGYAKAKSLELQPGEQLDISKLEALKGDWTAHATVNVYSAETGEYTQQERTWKVTIGDLTCPETLTEDIYDLFAAGQVSREAADAYFAEFKAQQTKFNESVRQQNRVLCQGWTVDDEREMSTASPWDLFTMKDYNASEVKFLYHDFGPKWFLEINKDGQIFIPVNYYRVSPLTVWFNGMDHYLCYANYEQKAAILVGQEHPESVEEVGIKVNVNEDGSLELIPMVAQFYSVDETTGEPVKDANGNVIFNDVWCYPNVLTESAQSSTGIAFYNSHVVSSVTLTKGWNGSATELPSVTPAKMSVQGLATRNRGVVPANVDYTAPASPYAPTAFMPKEANVMPKVRNGKMVTPEQTRKGMSKLMQKYNLVLNK